MSCVLRASGKQFDVDAFLKKSKLDPCAVFRRGEPKSKINPKSKKNTYSGINVPVSNASFDNLRRQIKDATTFLLNNKAEIRKLTKFKGVEGVGLDFGIRKRDTFTQSDEFPAELIAVAGSLGLSIMLSQYPISDE